MAKVKKDNRILTVDNDRLQSFLAQGYDQIGEGGKVIKRATGGRNVTIQQYNKLAEQLEELKKENEELKSRGTRQTKTAAK